MSTAAQTLSILGLARMCHMIMYPQTSEFNHLSVSQSTQLTENQKSARRRVFPKLLPWRMEETTDLIWPAEQNLAPQIRNPTIEQQPRELLYGLDLQTAHRPVKFQEIGRNPSMAH